MRAYLVTRLSRERGADTRYIGGATLIADSGLLVSAAEILSVEARHNTVLNILNGMPMTTCAVTDSSRIKCSQPLRSRSHSTTSSQCRCAIHLGRM